MTTKNVTSLRTQKSSEHEWIVEKSQNDFETFTKCYLVGFEKKNAGTLQTSAKSKTN